MHSHFFVSSLPYPVVANILTTGDAYNSPPLLTIPAIHVLCGDRRPTAHAYYRALSARLTLKPPFPLYALSPLQPNTTLPHFTLLSCELFRRPDILLATHLLPDRTILFNGLAVKHFLFCNQRFPHFPPKCPSSYQWMSLSRRLWRTTALPPPLPSTPK